MAKNKMMTSPPKPYDELRCNAVDCRLLDIDAKCPYLDEPCIAIWLEPCSLRHPFPEMTVRKHYPECLKMIAKDGMYHFTPVCDHCGEMLPPEDSWDDAVQLKKINGWRSVCRKGTHEWVDLCEDCQDPVIIHDYREAN